MSCADVAVVSMHCWKFLFQNASRSFLLFLNSKCLFLAMCSSMRSWSSQLEIPAEKYVACTIKSLPEVHETFEGPICAGVAEKQEFHYLIAIDV